MSMYCFDAEDNFWWLEDQRQKCGVSIDEAAKLVGVTPLAYKSWKNKGALPRGSKRFALRDAASKVEELRVSGLLPVKGVNARKAKAIRKILLDQ